MLPSFFKRKKKVIVFYLNNIKLKKIYFLDIYVFFNVYILYIIILFII